MKNLVICDSYLRELKIDKLKEYYLRTLKNYQFVKTTRDKYQNQQA